MVHVHVYIEEKDKTRKEKLPVTWEECVLLGIEAAEKKQKKGEKNG